MKLERFTWLRRLPPAALMLTLALAPVASVNAHGVRVGDLVVDHPYATPASATEGHAGVYFRSITNRSTRSDRLVSASTDLADSVVFEGRNSSTEPGPSFALDAIEIPGKAKLALTHRDLTRLKLVGLKRDIKAGDKFELTLGFEHSGSRKVEVWVQQPDDINVSSGH